MGESVFLERMMRMLASNIYIYNGSRECEKKHEVVEC
jgi:hypothetical protein